VRKDILPYYRVLGLSPGAGPNEIRRAYRQLVQQWHPDLFKPGSPMQTTAEDMTKEINEAYGQLFRKKLYRHYPPPEEAREPGAHGPAGAPGRRTDRPAAGAPKSRAAKASRWARVRRGWKALRRRRSVRWSAAALGLAALGAGVWSWWPQHPLALLGVMPAGTTASLPAAVSADPPRPTAAPTPDPPAPTAPPVAAVLPAPAPAPAEATRRRQWPTADHLLSLAPTWPGRPAEPDPISEAVPDKLAAADKLIAELFEPGDSKARVKAVQGLPDEEGNSVLRYGSSLVYFREGRVRGWVNREPRLRVPWWDDTVMPTVERFSTGSSRAEVVRAQGRPDGYSIDRYLYGTSEVRFSAGRVSGWSEGDVGLRAFDLPALPPARSRP